MLVLALIDAIQRILTTFVSASDAKRSTRIAVRQLSVQSMRYEPISSRNMRILVVHDDHDLLAVIEERLGNAGFDVLSASDAGEALERLNQHDVDILFSDVIMPGMSGLELAHQVLQRHRRVRVILTSGVVAMDRNLRDIQFVKKPYQFAELIAAIRKSN
jgi:CheY-like chemotaxis protein